MKEHHFVVKFHRNEHPKNYLGWKSAKKEYDTLENLIMEKVNSVWLKYSRYKAIIPPTEIHTDDDYGWEICEQIIIPSENRFIKAFEYGKYTQK
jgi:hypothetical protein